MSVPASASGAGRDQSQPFPDETDSAELSFIYGLSSSPCWSRFFFLLVCVVGKASFLWEREFSQAFFLLLESVCWLGFQVTIATMTDLLHIFIKLSGKLFLPPLTYRTLFQDNYILFFPLSLCPHLYQLIYEKLPWWDQGFLLVFSSDNAIPGHIRFDFETFWVYVFILFILPWLYQFHTYIFPGGGGWKSLALKEKCFPISQKLVSKSRFLLSVFFFKRRVVVLAVFPIVAFHWKFEP